MKFTWMPFFKELAEKLLEYEDTQEELISLLRRAGLKSGLEDKWQGQSISLSEIDPMTFFMQVLKYGKDDNRTSMFRKIKSELDIGADLPQDYMGVPHVQPLKSWMFAYKDDRKPDDIANLWEISRAVVKDSVSGAQWQSALEVKQVAIPRLTQSMFYLAPDKFLPVDKQTRPYLESHGIADEISDWNSYQNLLSICRDKFEKPFYELSHDAWASNQGSVSTVYKTKLTKGAINNGYIRILASCTIFEDRHKGDEAGENRGDLISVELPNGEVISTDIRSKSEGSGGRFRSRFGSLFKEYGVKAGDIAAITKLGTDRYKLEFVTSSKQSGEIQIDKELLALAVKKTIRPLLVDKGWLEEGSEEGYQHHRVIPRAREALSYPHLRADAQNAVIEAIKVSENLLSQYESVRPRDFLLQANPSEVSSNVIDLLFGQGHVKSRISRFLEWGDWNKQTTEGQKLGFNPTIVSYLLCMRDSQEYAFCKPENYQAAARALLGADKIEADYQKRIVHATAFYRAALKIFQEEHDLPFTDLMHVHIAFWLMKDPPDGGYPSWGMLQSSETGLDQGEDEIVRKVMKELNTILYGPPGTGKTYQTARLAVEIIDGFAPEDREKLMTRYRELRSAGRIDFITFHQSYSYEEFVEGIRPVLEEGDGDSGDVRFELKDGVFKRLCFSAEASSRPQQVTYDFDKSRVNMYKVSLGNTANPEEAQIFEDCIESNRIAVGFGWDIDYSGDKDRAAIGATMAEHGHDLQDNAYPPIAVNYFKNEIVKDDIVIVSDGNLKFRAIGRVTGDYEYQPELIYPHVRNVEWLRVFEESLPYEQLMNNRFSQMTIYYLSPKSIKIDALYSLLNPIQEKEPGSTVLIIDEINRGNISKILGELITLLEPDKRLGQANEIKVRLPYSGKEFGVPSNLYVIGTMNTADRSLAHVDTALRRRFTFEEIMPDPTLLKLADMQETQIDSQKLLTAMNRRIEVLIDRDHMIGHSYFMKGEDLSVVFKDRVIPLLTEYFFEDWSKVRAVLADDQTEDPSAQFINEEEVDSDLFNGVNLRHKKKVYSRNKAALTNPQAYLKIYSKIESE